MAEHESYARQIIRLGIMEATNVVHDDQLDRVTKSIESRLAYEGMLKSPLRTPAERLAEKRKEHPKGSGPYGF